MNTGDALGKAPPTETELGALLTRIVAFVGFVATGFVAPGVAVGLEGGATAGFVVPLGEVDAQAAVPDVDSQPAVICW
jgi:hypothetical protein